MIIKYQFGEIYLGVGGGDGTFEKALQGIHEENVNFGKE
jgi:hypothetical protein